MRKTLMLGAVLAMTVMGAGAASADDSKAMKSAVKYRSAVMTLVGSNFKPMGAMVKGEAEWDSAAFTKLATELAAVASLDQMRGYPEGSADVGDTEAKPEIWKNMDDFKSKMETFTKESVALADVAVDGDKAAMIEQFKTTAKTCKSCHDDYKKKD